jgi:hypothetical protein
MGQRVGIDVLGADQFLGDGQSQTSAAELGVTLPLCLLEGAKDLVRF